MRARTTSGSAHAPLVVFALMACGRIDFIPHQDARPSADAMVTGCADGEREGLLGEPDVAACSATWSGLLALRDPPAGAPCGDDLGPCTVAADACSPGWHLCGGDGDLAELARIGVAACDAAGAGAWVAASSHCAVNVATSGCMYPSAGETMPCFDSDWCAQPVCCGATCDASNLCDGGLFPTGTRTAGSLANGCGRSFQQDMVPITGFLCCR